MDQFLLPAIIAGLGALAGVLALNIRQAARVRKAARGGYLDRCRMLFDDVVVKPAITGFPRLSGRRDGQPFDIQIVPDTLTFRKLPALWVLVTLPAPLPVRATFDLMIRPTGVEPFSNFHTLPAQVQLPDGFPEDSAIRSDAPTHLPDEALLRRHLHVFDDPLMKEMVLSPRGARLVFLAEEAQRGRYLIYRDAEMGLQPLAPERLETQLEALLALRNDVLAPADPEPRSLSA